MNVRLSILLVLVLALVGGSVIITKELSTKKHREREDFLYKFNSADLRLITVTHGDRTVEYERQGDQWVIKDGNDTPVDTDKWSGTPLLLSGPRSSRLVIEPIDDPAKYGLDPPQTLVRILDRSNIPLDLHLGLPTPKGSDWYATVVGSDKLFTVAGVWGEVITKLVTKPPYPPTPEAPSGSDEGGSSQATGS